MANQLVSRQELVLREARVQLTIKQVREPNGRTHAIVLAEPLGKDASIHLDGSAITDQWGDIAQIAVFSVHPARPTRDEIKEDAKE